jgi:hypothetical protein
MNREQLARYAAIAYAGLAGQEPRMTARVHPQPGIEIRLTRQPDGGMMLKAIRESYKIDGRDAEIIADAFGVPAGSEPLHTKRKALKRISLRPIQEYVFTWTWRETGPGDGMI